jgi:hypothetical protein
MLSSIIIFGQSKNEDLKKVFNKLEKIESATYNIRGEGWAPADTAASIIMNYFIKEYNNPQDSTIGASFVSLLQKDTTQMTFSYDGKMRAVVFLDDKSIVIDSFTVRKLPFRPLTPPFFNFTKSIIKYALETKDSISIKIEIRRIQSIRAQPYHHYSYHVTNLKPLFQPHKYTNRLYMNIFFFALHRTHSNNLSYLIPQINHYFFQFFVELM